MAQQKDEYGAAQGLVDDFGKVVSFFNGKPKAEPPAKPDTSWHDQMVKQAQESFQKAPSKASDGPKLGQRKKKSKAAKKKAPAAKRA